VLVTSAMKENHCRVHEDDIIETPRSRLHIELFACSFREKMKVLSVFLEHKNNNRLSIFENNYMFCDLLSIIV